MRQRRTAQLEETGQQLKGRLILGYEVTHGWLALHLDNGEQLCFPPDAIDYLTPWTIGPAPP